MGKTTSRLALGVVSLFGLVGLAAAGEKQIVSLEEFIQRLPARVTDKDGTPGDMVNFVLVGSRAQVEKALAAADWKQVDRTPAEAIVRILGSILDNRAYTELPMSELFLFGRAQDFGFARAEPVSVVAERHHFRLWESPWQTSDGDDIWIGAGTHDVGFEEDQRTGDVTHKIDPEVDKERDFIAQTLAGTGRTAGLGYLRVPTPLREAFTAHGGAFRSDGRVLIVVLK
ncbi:MAG: LssY C-terminal domain-containing protein [Candidatus Acidiferrales bacterium]